MGHPERNAEPLDVFLKGQVASDGAVWRGFWAGVLLCRSEIRDSKLSFFNPDLSSNIGCGGGYLSSADVLHQQADLQFLN